ncbi:MAG TPA: adenylate cyclase regulatory domain-containing protein [Thermoleophilaceae bacterium]|nr:adenylate cyclase regulatory domain-containing protein [Thermoleophilaceae bacterium]
MNDERLTLNQVAERAGVSPATLRRWVKGGLIPQLDEGDGRAWSQAAAAQARVVARLRDRGHTIDQIREATDDGRLAFGFVEELLPDEDGDASLKDVAKATGLEPALIERLWNSFGLPARDLEAMSDEDVEAMREAAGVLSTGLPLVATLQLARVYGQALSQIADAEVRLIHLYVHEPLMREGVPGLQMAEQMESLARDLLPRSSTLMEYLHRRFLQHFVAQDVVGHMEVELDGEVDLGRLRVGICFCDLAGYTRFTEEEGDEQALSYVERFVDRISETLPDDARVVKTIGDEAMIVGQDIQALTEWAVSFQGEFAERPEPRIGIHYGAALYRDGDYFGREVNLASRVVARARGGEVLATDAVVEHVAASSRLTFEGIGQVKLKGFDEPRQLCRATGFAR